MTEQKTESVDGSDRGCLFIIGIVIIGICIGNIYTAAAGWLVIGCGLVLAAIFSK